MITIKMLAAWFMLSSFIFALSVILFNKVMDNYRSANTLFVLAAQGLAATILALLT